MNYFGKRHFGSDRLPEAHQLITRGLRLRLSEEDQPLAVERAEVVIPGVGARRAWPLRGRPANGRRRIFPLVVAFIVSLVAATVIVVVVKGPRATSVKDQFSDIRASLDGSHPTGGGEAKWKVASGAFAINDNAAFAPATGIVSIATIHVEKHLTAVRVEVSPVGDGSGIVFRYVDPQDYWSLTAAASYGTWNISRVVHGERQFVGNTGLGLNRAGSTIAIEITDQFIRVLIDGVQRQVVFDSALKSGAGAGLIAASEDDGATRWRKFQITGR